MLTPKELYEVYHSNTPHYAWKKLPENTKEKWERLSGHILNHLVKKNKGDKDA